MATRVRRVELTQEQDCACPHSNTCPMYDLFRRSGTLGLWKINFCNADYESCARFQRNKEGRAVPQSLLPNGRSLGLV